MATVAGYSATIIPVPHTCDYLKLSIECGSHCCPTRPCSTRQGRELQAPGPSCLIELGSAPGATGGGHRVSPGETSGIFLQLAGNHCSECLAEASLKLFHHTGSQAEKMGSSTLLAHSTWAMLAITSWNHPGDERASCGRKEWLLASFPFSEYK